MPMPISIKRVILLSIMDNFIEYLSRPLLIVIPTSKFYFSKKTDVSTSTKPGTLYVAESTVLKTGSDRPVQPVKPGTGESQPVLDHSLIQFMSYRLEKHMSCQMMVAALFFLILQTNLLFFSVESFCYNNGNYTLNSTYSNNLDTALSSIPANIGISGFYNASAGSRNPDIAYAIALCRGDVQPPTCRECIRNLTARLRAACPNQRQAIEWEDSCMLRYSNQTILGIMETRPALFMSNVENATNPGEFLTYLRGHLDNLRDLAANGGPLRKVAAANVRANDFQYIFALVQCTPDLSSDDCTGCLIAAAAEIPTCCDRRRGGRVLYPSCNLRYERYPFFNETRLQELVPVPPSPAPQPPLAPVTPLPPSPDVDEISTIESLKYTLSTIRAATNDFSDDNKLGQGGFGAVYKGKLSNDQEIAVKRLSKDSGQGDLEFKNEVLLLAKLQHRNLVRLLGFCLEGIEKLLIYEFVQNASLDQFIFDPVKRSVLDWEKRYKIIGGIARGILYLHEDSQVRIIHRDLKPSNVLLDGAMNPKIADFGMARLFGHDDTQGNTSKIAGTFGYMAPEYAMHGQFSIKSDVFSFGVLVLEIISGQKNNNVQLGENVQDLLTFAWKNWNGRTPAELVDPCLRSGSGSISDMVRCIHIGLLCVQENAADRPTMASVVLMLNSVSLTLAAPTEPAFYMPSHYGSDSLALLHENNSSGYEYKNSSNSNAQTQSDTSSRNEASISDLYPR
ncbi:cysteine-rich receptor-like protein kinase 41 [Phtheirospermum japonicum]|uniref:Cysteine-rich receptor-like protein kinase 41 n=1 Tax=Phtheirospermum japonicum TaxID=374723 RepID=A0A830CJY2_9LAMI|nr:cysteine-rich receptor-like protein kinase 41 [Phtheirospermum japonicum]